MGEEKEELEKYKALFEAAPDGVAFVDNEGIIREVNQKACEFLEVSENDLVEMPLVEQPFYSGGDREKFLKRAEKSLEGESVPPTTYELETEGGEKRYIEMNNSIIKKDGEFKGLVLIARDITDRKEIKKKLGRSEAELSAIFENIPIIIMLVDRDRRVRKINNTGLEFAGKTEDEITGQRGGRALRCVHHLDDPKSCGFGPFCEDCTVRNTVLDTFETGGSHFREEGTLPFEQEGERKEITFWVSTALIGTEEGERVLVSIEDITRQKKIEGELRKSKEKFRSYVENAPNGVFIVDAEGNHIEVNKSACKMTGYSEEELLNMKVPELLPPEAQEEASEAFEELLETGKIRVELPYLRKNGNQRHWIINAVKLSEDRYLGFTEDITERKKAEAKRHEYQELLTSTLDAVDSLLLVIDENHRIILSNWKDHEWVPKDKRKEMPYCYEVFKNFDSPCEYCPPVKTFEDGKTRQYEDQNPIDGSYKEISVVPIFDENDNVKYVLENVRDVTERKKAEERKEFLNNLLKQDLQSKYQTIQGYHQLLEEANLTEEQRDYLKKAVKAGREADEILELAKNLREIEKTEWVAEKDIVKILEHIIDDISDLAKKQNVEIEENYPEKIGGVKGDYSLIILFSQILKIRIQTSECDRIRISAKEKDNRITLKVEDNGKKLPEDIKNLFSGELYTGETTGAGGVRYYMLRQIAEHNNGEIKAQDSEIGGARFDVDLRRA